MLKTFNELRKINVMPFTKKRDGNDYLNWAKCKELLHENGYYTPTLSNWNSQIR